MLPPPSKYRQCCPTPIISLVIIHCLLSTPVCHLQTWPIHRALLLFSRLCFIYLVTDNFLAFLTYSSTQFIHSFIPSFPSLPQVIPTYYLPVDFSPPPSLSSHLLTSSVIIVSHILALWSAQFNSRGAYSYDQTGRE